MITTARKEFLVGCLVILVFVLLGVFAWLMGVFDPFGSANRFRVLYDFAGGVEIGAPVRVAGVKVGRVERIEFLSGRKAGEFSNVALQLTLSVSPSAAASVREDSRFFINMAGIIGERYIEISPGSEQSAVLRNGATVRGEDPPRIDQLLSQGYGVFSKIQDFIDRNQKTAEEFLDQLHLLMGDANQLLKRKDWKKLGALIDNLSAMTEDLRTVTAKLQKPEAQEVIDKLYDMVNRAHEIDKATLQKFLQEEGIRARIF